MSIIGIILGVVAIGLFSWLRKKQILQDGLHEAELQHTHQGMNALMNDFNNYQVTTDRKIAELEKQLTIEKNTRVRQLDNLKKELPIEIQKVINHIEFAKPLDNTR